MRIIFLRTFLILTTVLIFTECKKGEDDPLVSLRTRKMRLTGTWTLTGGKALYHDPVNNINYTFDGSNYTAVIRLGNKLSDTTADYNIQLEILKNGRFKLKETYQSTDLICSGNWNFNEGVGKQKGKADAVFSIDEVTGGFTTEHFFNRLAANFVYQIKELRNRKLVLYSTGRIYSTKKGSYATFTNEYTFTQK